MLANRNDIKLITGAAITLLLIAALNAISEKVTHQMSDQSPQPLAAHRIDGSSLFNVGNVYRGKVDAPATILANHTPTNVATITIAPEQDGIFLVIARGGFAADPNGGRDVSIKVNNAVKSAEAGMAVNDAFGLGNVLTCSAILDLVGGDELELEMTQNSGGPLAIVVATEISSLEFIRLAKT